MTNDLYIRGRGLAARVYLAALLVSCGSVAWAASPDSAPPLPAPTGPVLTASTVSELQARIGQLTSGATLVIQPGTYQLTGTLYIGGNLTNVTIRGATNNRNDVVLVGKGMSAADDGGVPYGIWTGNGVTGITIANLTIRDVYYHPIVLNSGTESPRIYNVRLLDAGQQFIKANPDGAGGGVDNGVVEYSVLEYSDTARDAYTNGVDVHTGRNWIVRNNLFKRIRAPQGQLAGPAILMWNGSSGTVAEGNTFIDCQREIAFGLIERSPDDHSGGVIRNNFLYRNANAGGDVAIGVFDSPGTKVVHNTIFMNGTYPSAIEYRFVNTTGVAIVNNLGDRGAQARDGATASLAGNVWSAAASMFVNPAAGDLHLNATAAAAIDKVAVNADASNDWDGQARPQGSAADIGADELSVSPGPGGAPINCTVSAWSAWAPISDWSACSGGTQTRTERRTRTILTQPANGGTPCPALEETRTVSQACEMPPPPEVCGDGIDNDRDGLIDEGCALLPGAPSRLARRVKGDRVSFSWLAPISGGAPTGYNVEAGLAPGGTDFTVPVGLRTSTTVSGVGTGRYYVRVRAVNAAGAGAPSNEVVVSVGCTKTTSAARLSATTNGGLVTLAWTDPDGCSGTSYQLQVGSEPGLSNIAAAPIDGESITTAAPAGTYYARVVPVSDAGVGEPSNEVKVIVNGHACQPPTFATTLAASVAGGNVSLTWGPAPSNAAAAILGDQMSPVGYILEIGSAAGAADLGVVPVGRATTLATPAPPGTYYVRMRPTDSCGAGRASNEVIVQVR